MMVSAGKQLLCMTKCLVWFYHKGARRDSTKKTCLEVPIKCVQGHNGIYKSASYVEKEKAVWWRS